MLKITSTNSSIYAAFFLGFLAYTSAFAVIPPRRHSAAFARISHTTRLHAEVVSTPVENVIVLKDDVEVSAAIRKILADAASEAIEDHGYFALAIPGGSILKMLVGEDVLGDWTTKTTIVYVNHKCVNMDDLELSTHAKARKLFLDKWVGCNTLILDGTDDGDSEASAYEDKMRALSEDVLPRDGASSLPVFDLALIGVGDDGHVGSLYPGREEVLVGDDGAWVLPVAMKHPPSITLSLPIMANAKKVVVAACGVSDKYPQGKSAGMRRAVSADDETLQTFPAVGLRSKATWIMDQAAASKLGSPYV